MTTSTTIKSVQVILHLYIVIFRSTISLQMLLPPARCLFLCFHHFSGFRFPRCFSHFSQIYKDHTVFLLPFLGFAVKISQQTMLFQKLNFLLLIVYWLICIVPTFNTPSESTAYESIYLSFFHFRFCFRFVFFVRFFRIFRVFILAFLTGQCLYFAKKTKTKSFIQGVYILQLYRL